jgi:hypothetical protein
MTRDEELSELYRQLRAVNGTIAALQKLRKRELARGHGSAAEGSNRVLYMVTSRTRLVAGGGGTHESPPSSFSGKLLSFPASGSRGAAPKEGVASGGSKAPY